MTRKVENVGINSPCISLTNTHSTHILFVYPQAGCETMANSVAVLAIHSMFV